MSTSRKHEIISFKVDEALHEALMLVDNRSDFIRNAVLHALQNGCPLCHGTGVLTVAQRRHWDDLMERHDVVVCETCHAPHLVCHATGEEHVH